jgi:hypothetical protein
VNFVPYLGIVLAKIYIATLSGFWQFRVLSRRYNATQVPVLWATCGKIDDYRFVAFYSYDNMKMILVSSIALEPETISDLHFTANS